MRSGFTGGGFIALAATMPAIDVLPLGGLALLLGVDRFMAEIRAATNLMSNVIATLIVARWAGVVDYERATRMLNGELVEGDRAAVSPALAETTGTRLATAG